MASLRLFPSIFRLNLFAVSVLWLVNVFTDPTLAQESVPSIQPKICVGWYPDQRTEPWRNSLAARPCPKDFAVFSTRMTGGVSRWAEPQAVPLLPECCPLPSEDILTGEQVSTTSICPKNFIVVAGSDACNFVSDKSQCTEQILCEKVNTQRYQLGEVRSGIYWGVGVTRWKQEKQVMHSHLPLGMRYGVGRIGPFSWTVQGCVGDPFGSLLVGKTSKRCHGQSYQRLEYRGQKGDPPQGTAVQMFPACTKISSEFEESPQCIN